MYQCYMYEIKNRSATRGWSKHMANPKTRALRK